MSATPLRIAVLLSGEGTSLENLFEQIDAGAVPAQVVLVVASKPKAGGLARAQRRGVPALAVPRKKYPDPGAFNDALHAVLADYEIDLVALLGFLSPFETRGRFRGFYGQRVHEAVLESGVRYSGATVHFVDAEYDHGPIILQEPVEVRDDDTADSLAARVQEAERRLVPEAIRLFAAGRLRIAGRRVRIADSDVP